MRDIKPGLDYDTDASLRRVVELGLGNAARGLSEMVGEEMRLTSIGMRLTPLQDIPQAIGEPEAVVVGLYQAILGDMSGHIILIFSREQAWEMVDMVMGLPEGSTAELGPMETSALSEVANLTGSFFLNALADVTQSSIHPTPPVVIIDMGGAILDVAIADIGQESNETLLIETVFARKERQATGYFLVMPRPSSLGYVLRKVNQ